MTPAPPKLSRAIIAESFPGGAVLASNKFKRSHLVADLNSDRSASTKVPRRTNLIPIEGYH
jgi:hypothetical protein